MKTKKTDIYHWTHPTPRFLIVWNHHIGPDSPPSFIPLNRKAFDLYHRYRAEHPVTFRRSFVTLKHQFVLRPRKQ